MILYLMITHIYIRRKQERPEGLPLFFFSQRHPVGWLLVGISRVWATSEWWWLWPGGLTLPPYLCSAFCKVSLKNPLSLLLWQLRPSSSGHPNMFKVLHDHMFAHWGAEQGRAGFCDLHPAWAMNTPGSARLGSCQVSTVVEHPRHATGARQAFGSYRHTERVDENGWGMTSS